MKTSRIAAIFVLALVGIGLAAWMWLRASGDNGELTLYGNVDVRQVSLAFEESGRIAQLGVEEGDTVKAGQVLARLDTTTQALQLRQAKAEADARDQALQQLRNGSRPEEIAQAQENVNAAQAEATRAGQDLARLREVGAATAGKGISPHDLDVASSAAKAAQAHVDEARQALALARKGPREEQVRMALAQFDGAKAQVAVLQHQVAMGVLRAPSDGVVRSRLLEVGAMASPQQAVFDIALVSPKWVRVYVNEADLGRVRPGMRALVSTDSAPDTPVSGRIGYISSVAEFTPKSVETQDLRTALVYEVRIMVSDPGGRLRLGQPVTVKLDIGKAR